MLGVFTPLEFRDQLQVQSLESPIILLKDICLPSMFNINL